MEKLRSRLQAVQLRKLQGLLRKIIPANPFWTEKFRAAGIDIAGLQTWDDFRRWPFVTKAELMADQESQPPYGTNLTSPAAGYFRLHQTSGTTGAPLRWLDTPASWDWMLGSWRQLFDLAGISSQDRLFFAFSFGPFLGFWTAFEAASRRGQMCLPAGGLSSAGRLQLLLQNRATVVCCTPTYALRLAEVAEEQYLDLARSDVRALLVAGEAGGNIAATRRRLEEAWGATVIDHWGMTEIGPLAIEPSHQRGGLCLLETECIAEIIDPDTGNAMPEGAEGELVVTNLGRNGSPLLRYRTGDRVRAGAYQPAEVAAELAGSSRVIAPDDLANNVRSLPLLWLEGGILGRVDDMIVIRGNNLYPSALEDVIREFPDIVEFRIEVRSVKSMPHVRIEIEPTAQAVADGSSAGLVTEIGQRIKSRWNFQAEVTAVAVGSLPRFEMKGRRFHRLP